MADDIKSLDQLKDAVTASAGGVQGSTADEQRSYQPLAAPREPQRHVAYVRDAVDAPTEIAQFQRHRAAPLLSAAEVRR